MNYDASPTLRLQRIPILGGLARAFSETRFPVLAAYGDIVRGLPVAADSVDLVYCSHVLEHLAFRDLRQALAEVMRIMKPGGVFRGVLPDLEAEASYYLSDAASDACTRFMQRTYLGWDARPRGVYGLLRNYLGNSQHLWMWDFKGLRAELLAVGFEKVRRAEFGDSEFAAFLSVEDWDRWQGAFGFECTRACDAPFSAATTSATRRRS
jgi:SAM-dependent methyltransferase